MHRLHGALREFSQAILNPYDLDDLLSRLTGHATAALQAAGTGIMLEGRDGGLGFAAASSESVMEAERHQEHVGTGASYDAFKFNRTVNVDDLRTTDRWPTYTPKVVALGLATVISAPMNAHGTTIGVLNVYGGPATAWTEDDVQAVEVLAAMGAGYILHANQLHASQRLAEQLQHALDSRAIIERAKGLLMAKESLDADGAFAHLRQASMDTNRRLREVAAEVVGSHVPSA